MKKIIEVKNLYKLYKLGDSAVRALNGVSLEIYEGEFCAIVGTSGSGKSTMLNMLAGLEKPTKGEVIIDGQHIENLKEDQLVRFRREKVGFIFQSFQLLGSMNALENVALPLNFRGVPKAQRLKKADKMLDLVKLKKHKKHLPNQMSGGQQQRVALARAIVMKPKVLLLDEPLSAIDAKLRKSLQIEIRRIQKELNMTTVFVTHDQDEAMVMSDRICLLNQGQIEQSGTPVEIYTAPKTRFAASFIGSYNVFTPNEYTMLTAGKEKTETSVAIRPETIAIAKEKPGRDHCLEVYGTIQESITRGNVLRYTVDVNGVKLQADTLFRSFSIFQTGERVWLSVEHKNCLQMED